MCKKNYLKKPVIEHFVSHLFLLDFFRGNNQEK